MQTIDILKEKTNRAYLLSQKARRENRKKRLRDLYRRYYQTYRRQRFLIEEIDGLSSPKSISPEVSHATV